MVDVVSSRPGCIDLSFMPSLECDLACAHCMYSSSPKTLAALDYERVEAWCDTVDWKAIHAAGFYGGEPALDLQLYQRYLDLVPEDVPRFVITNGTWSQSAKAAVAFTRFVKHNRLQVTISGTEWHRPHQDLTRLRILAAVYGWRLKGDESHILPMGRAKSWVPSGCSHLCQRWTKPWRIALHPTRHVIFQSCDGSYPVLQTLDEPFANVLPNIAKLICQCPGRPENGL